MRYLCAALGLLVLAPSASGLASLTHDDRANTLRIHLEGDAIQARATEGAPSVEGRELTGNWTTLEDVEFEPWRGYERTARLRYGGNGTMLLADGESGLWLQPGAPDASDRRSRAQDEGDRSQSNHTEDGGRDADARGSTQDDRSDAQRPARPTKAGNASSHGAAKQRPMQADEGAEPGDDPGGEETESSRLILWGGVLLGAAVGVGPWLLDLARKRLRRIGSAGLGESEDPRSEEPPDGSEDPPYPWLAPGSRRGGQR